ncbi:lasso peptide biosynthesis PqqD family chaperone [Kibdelosporangium aridum]|uniref:PqqD family protein, HPr-rel-A system n=1 Tax=Kibdelosporangium aridum TaxID=2030 RepID=A0A1W2FS48_KIBAR|nr:lasso peptide biosynthesis PqqD family chaperone [Kibdelosporangium aridum]SMD24693.1 PqqD family protein, HPr-rel-A system [Kibdelosporangium aridum]
MLELREDVSLTDTDYGTVLLDERSGEYWMLNPTAALVLRTLLAGGTSEDAANQLATEFDVDPRNAIQDVDVLLDELGTAGLVRQPPNAHQDGAPADTTRQR